MRPPYPLALLAILLALVSPVAAQAPDASAGPVRVTPDAIANYNSIQLRGAWRYHPGDDPAWADPAYDDSAWETLDIPRQLGGASTKSGWPGIGWFRLRLSVDPALAGVPMAIQLLHNGASEIYVDGRIVHTFGTVAATTGPEISYDPNRTPVPVVFDRPGEHVLVVRYSCTESADGATNLGRVLTGNVLPAGFQASLADAAAATTVYGTDLTVKAFFTTSFIGVLSAFGVLHLFLYLFDRRQRANLFYSLFAFSFALNSFCGLLMSSTHIGYEETAYVMMANRVFIGGIFVFFLAFLYAAYAFPIPKYYWAIVVAWVLIVFAITAAPITPIVMLSFPLGIFASVSAAMLAMVNAFRKRIDGSWIIGAGVIFLAIAMTAQLVAGIGLLPRTMQMVAFFAFIGLPLCVSAYLARAFVRTSRDLETKLVEVETLSAEAIEHERRETLLRAENERRAEELEEARQLQLSMLPKTVPDLPNLEIAAYMKPATEVGGDYYDFHVAEDGTLTVAVGDATGHGLKAGTLVTATKGLFNAMADEPDIARFFHRSSHALKRLNLRYLYMALMLAKVNGNHVRLSAAGMPPALVYRSASGEVEEVVIQGLPLGGGARFPYQEREIELAPADVLVFMSDGFPERFNASGEMLDYDVARRVLAESADRSAREIIDHFVNTGETWADGHPQNDDVTFVVMKVREQV